MLKPKPHEIRKPSKTLSGVTPLAVVLKPKACNHGICLYCPSLHVPQSYTPKSPAIMRAMMLDYNAYKQVKARLRAYSVMNHPTDKIELIIMGGTFLDYPIKYQEKFVKDCYDALNNKKSRNLSEAKKKNETAKHRCVALCIETRPDVCGKQEIQRILNYGCTRVELGVQAIDNKIYEKVKRGHTVKDVIDATKLLKDSGFKVGYHIMPGLPGMTTAKDLKMFRKLFNDQRFKPDQLKIYPCQVIRGAELEKWYWQEKYKPYNKQELKKLLIRMLKIIPNYCRVMRIMREIPPAYLIAGVINIDLRSEFEKEIRDTEGKNKIKINEIRFREIGRQKNKENIDRKVKIKITKYKASEGEEYFIEAVNKNKILFGLLRLRFPDKVFIDELKDAVIIRELHVYGKAIEIGKSGKQSQHIGIGKMLMQKAEKIVEKENNKNKQGKKFQKIAVISGVGVREYYKKLGYKLKGNYMVKRLN